LGKGFLFLINMNNLTLYNLLFMDGQGLFVWSVFVVLLFVLIWNLYIPYKKLQKIISTDFSDISERGKN